MDASTPQSAMSPKVTTPDLARSFLLHVFGPDGVESLRNRNWTFIGIAAPILGIISDVCQIAEPVAQPGLIFFSSLFALLAAAVVFRTRYCRECAFPCVVALILTICFGTIVGVRAIAKTDPDKSFVINTLTDIKDATGEIRKDTKIIQQQIKVQAGQLDNVEAGQATLQTGVAENNALLKRTLAAIESQGDIARAQAGGLKREAIVKLANRAKIGDLPDLKQMVAALEQLIDVALDVISKGRRPSDEDSFVNDVLKTVAGYTQKGETDQASTAVDNALTELDRREQQQAESSRRSRLTLTQAGLEQDILRRDAPAAARRVQQIFTLEHPDASHEDRFESLRNRQNDFYERGRDKGTSFDLSVSIELARLTVNIAADPDQRGIALNDLGSALTTLGKRESDTARLEQAVEALRAALTERTRERVPLGWAMTQNNLGNALQTLGERESDPARLEQAVEAHRAALTEYTRDRVPLDWAMTQNNLGTALASLGERESDPVRLEQAVEAYRAALTERTRERVPLHWATTQNNLGIALATLGERESDTARLQQAVEAYRAALTEYTRERVPLDWAMTQNNLGIALATLGERESDTARLQQAVEAYRAALTERTREKTPFDWALTQENLGILYFELARRGPGTEHAEQSVSAYKNALEVYEAGQADYYIEKCRRGLEKAESLLAERRQG